MINSSRQLTALHRFSHQVKWVTELPTGDDPDQPYHYASPIIVNGMLLLIHDAGEALLIDPDNGEIGDRVPIADHIHSAPVVAQGALFLISDDATLYRYD